MITSIIILTWNNLNYTKACIDSIRLHTTPGTYEIIIVDNASTDDTVEWLKEQPDLKVVYNADNKGFPAGCNQGIEIATGDNILLLNNDVIVTARWLDNLVQVLYSADDIGAVGPTTNSAAYLQKIPVAYQTLDEMHRLSAAHNRIDPNLWEERLKLIGFCMLIRGEIVRQIGLLDDRFTPGNFEDDDYSVRIRQLGYRLIYCKDTFIHHFGSTSWREDADRFHKLLTVNEGKFEEKWGFNATTAMNFYPDMVSALQPPHGPFRVLEVLCGAGATLLRIKNHHPQAELYGIEPNEQAALQGRAFADIRATGLDVSAWGFAEEFFDVILLPFVLEEAAHPQRFLHALTRLLKPSGQVIAKVKNSSHFRVIDNLMRGLSPYPQSGMRYYTNQEIHGLFEDAGYGRFRTTDLKSELSDEDRRIVERLASFTDASKVDLYTTVQWLVQAKLGPNRIRQLLDRIGEEQEVADALIELNALPVEEVIHTILMRDGSISLFNRVASLNFQHQHVEHVLPYLQKANEIEPTHQDTLFNLGFILQMLGEHQHALHFLQQIVDKDEQVVTLIMESQTHFATRKSVDVKLKFLLHRIEFEVHQEEMLDELFERMQSDKITLEDVLDAIHTFSVEPIRVLNVLGASCYSRELYDAVLPFLQAALEFDSQHVDTLFNLGVMLYQMGDDAQSLHYLHQIPSPDESVRELISMIRA